MDAPAAPVDFARTVSQLLDDGAKENALQLSADGVRTFPTYIGGYIVLADCYAALGSPDDAEVILNEAERRFPGREIVQQRRDLLEELKQSIQRELELKRETEEKTEEKPRPMVVRRPPRERKKVVKPRKTSPLRVIDLGQPENDTRVIRSSSVRLIPGLEFTSLRFEASRSMGEHSINILPEPPSFRAFHKVTPIRKAEGGRQKTEGGNRKADGGAKKKVSLEELANRIGKVRMTPEDLESRPPAPDPMEGEQKPSLVTETLAKIYMQQKSFDKAIESFETLKKRYPDRADEFQKLIDECVKERDAE